MRAVIATIFLVAVSSLTMAEPCSIVDEFPHPSWVKRATSTAIGSTEKEAREQLAIWLSTQIDVFRNVCLEFDGEAYWYRPSQIACLPLKGGIFCEQSVETECERKDY